MVDVSSLCPHDTMDINTGSMNNYICKTFLSWLILNKTETSMKSESKVRRDDKPFSKTYLPFPIAQREQLKEVFYAGAL